MRIKNFRKGFAECESKKEVRMSSEHYRQLKPFLSVFFIISTLFTIVFLKMEERRMSYVVLKQTREFKKLKEAKKQKEIQLAKLTRPQFVETVAKEHLTLKRAVPAQIIRLNPSVSISYLSEKEQSGEALNQLSIFKKVLQ